MSLTQHPAFVMTNQRENRARQTSEPMPTMTTATGGGHALVEADMRALVHRNNSGGAEMTTPVFEELRTLTTAGHQALLQSGRRALSPADLRDALDMVDDVLFRMFRPHEVAAGMAFPADYQWNAIDPEKGRPASNADVTKMAGNAVTPPAARDLIATVVEAITGEAVAA